MIKKLGLWIFIIIFSKTYNTLDGFLKVKSPIDPPRPKTKEEGIPITSKIIASSDKNNRLIWKIWKYHFTK